MAFNISSATKLPTEMILEIFKYSMVQDDHARHDPTIMAMSVSQVCREWRAIALNYHALWTKYLDLSKPIALLRNVIIPRCASGRFDRIIFPEIAKHFQEEENLDLDDSLQSHLRTQSIDVELADLLELVAPLLSRSPKQIILELHAQDWDMLNTLVFSQRELSDLETLIIARKDTSTGPDFSRQPNYNLPSLDQRLPSTTSFWTLKTLGLHGCTTFLSFPALSMLENLSLSHLPTPIAYTPVIILGILKNMPRLRMFKLKQVTLTEHHHVRTRQALGQQALLVLNDPVELPLLEKLVLEAPLEDTRVIIYALKTPATCRLGVIGNELEHDLAAVNKLLSVVDEINRKSPPNYTNGISACVEFKACRYAIRVVEDAPEGGNTRNVLGLAIEWGMGHHDFLVSHSLIVNNILTNGLQHLHHATCLKVDLLGCHESLVRLLDTEHFLFKFPNVVVVQIFGVRNCAFFLEHFRHAYRPGASISSYPLRSLKRIVFKCIDFSVKPNDEDGRTFGDILLEYVKRRDFRHRGRDYSIRSIGS